MMCSFSDPVFSELVYSYRLHEYTVLLLTDYVIQVNDADIKAEGKVIIQGPEILGNANRHFDRDSVLMELRHSMCVDFYKHDAVGDVVCVIACLTDFDPEAARLILPKHQQRSNYLSTRATLEERYTSSLTMNGVQNIPSRLFHAGNY